MGKVKIKKKDTRIDMTAMSDVTVLLLTFFMLTSTFLSKEPVQVITPPSVSEEKVPDEKLLSVLLSPDGHILGKMGHSERYEDSLFRNISGNCRQPLFENAVNYFKHK